MNEQQQLIKETLQRLLTDLCPPEVVDNAEHGTWPEELWNTLTETGLTMAGIPEVAGGSGGDTEDSLLVIREAAGFAAPVPLAEHFLAATLLAEQGAMAGAEPMTIATGDFELDDNLVLKGRADEVAFARWCSQLVLVANSGSGAKLCRVNLQEASISPGTNMAGEPRDSLVLDLTLDAADVFDVTDATQQNIRTMGAGLRGLMMAGALESVLEMSVQYSMDRSQFGRPISKFQAIQQQLAVLAGEVAASTMAGHAISAAFAGVNELDIGIGKSRIGEAVSLATDIAHQVHGAMGYTLEHSLNHRTRRLWCWRNEYGSERAWQIQVGQAFLGGGPEGLWDGITQRA